MKLSTLNSQLSTLFLLLLAACTAGEAQDPGFPAEEAPLVINQARITGAGDVTITRQGNNLTHSGGEIWIAVGEKTAWYRLGSDNSLALKVGEPILTLPRNHAQAEGLAAYGFVTGVGGGVPGGTFLPIHAAPDDYPVTWTDPGMDTQTATLQGAIALTPAVAAIHISLQDGKGTELEDFIIQAHGIYQPADSYNPTNWTKDDTGTYHIKARTYLARGSDNRDIYTAPVATLTANDLLFTIKGLTGNYADKTWLVRVPQGLTSLDAGKRYNFTITLEGSNATIKYQQITDWNQGTGNFQPNAYRTVSDWAELVAALEDAATTDINILQTADITCPDTDDSRQPKNLSRGCLFNGNGYTLSGLKQPLFNEVWGQVYNVHLRDCQVTNGSIGNTGLLANQNSGFLTLCSATGTLQQTAGGHAGGLVGVNDGYITRCYTDVEVTANHGSEPINAGGLAGDNQNSITACAAFGTVENMQPLNEDAKTGTLVGQNRGTVAYSYALATGSEIGWGGTVKTSDRVTPTTLVRDANSATGIAWEGRRFDGATGNWWSGTADEGYTIDFTYEGAQPSS